MSKTQNKKNIYSSSLMRYLRSRTWDLPVEAQRDDRIWNVLISLLPSCPGLHFSNLQSFDFLLCIEDT